MNATKLTYILSNNRHQFSIFLYIIKYFVLKSIFLGLFYFFRAHFCVLMNIYLRLPINVFVFFAFSGSMLENKANQKIINKQNQTKPAITNPTN